MVGDVQVVGIKVRPGRADRNLIAGDVERAVDRTGLVFLVVVIARAAGQGQVRRDVEIDRAKGCVLLVATLGVFTKGHVRAARAGNVERGIRVGRHQAKANAARCGDLRRGLRLAAGGDRFVIPILVVLNLERFIVGTQDCTNPLAFRRGHAEFVALVRGADVVGPVPGRRIAIRCAAIVTEVIVSGVGALIEDAIGRTRVVGVITLLRNVARHIGAGVDHLEIANLAVQRPGGVPVIVGAVLRHEQRRRQAGQRLIVIAVGLRGKRALGVQLLIRFGQQQIPVGRNLPAEFDAAADIVDRVEILLHLLGIVVLARVGLLTGGQGVVVVPVGHIVRTQVGRLTRERRIDVVDIAAVVIVIDHCANGQLILDDRDIDHRVERGIGCATGGAAKAAFHLAFDAVVLGLGRDVTHGTGLRTAAEQRTLRAFKHFDAFDIGNIDVGVVRRELHRLVIKIQRHVGEAADRTGRLFTGKTGGQAAHEDRALARAVVPEGYVGGVFQQIVERGHVQLAQRIRVERLQRHRHVLQRLVTTLRGHDDFARIGRRGHCIGSRRLCACRAGQRHQRRACKQTEFQHLDTGLHTTPLGKAKPTDRTKGGRLIGVGAVLHWQNSIPPVASPRAVSGRLGRQSIWRCLSLQWVMPGALRSYKAL